MKNIKGYKKIQINPTENGFALECWGDDYSCHIEYPCKKFNYKNLKSAFKILERELEVDKILGKEQADWLAQVHTR